MLQTGLGCRVPFCPISCRPLTTATVAVLTDVNDHIVGDGVDDLNVTGMRQVRSFVETCGLPKCSRQHTSSCLLCKFPLPAKTY